MGKVMEQGPVLVMTFQSQQILCVKDSNGNVIEGDPVSIEFLEHCETNKITIFLNFIL